MVTPLILETGQRSNLTLKKDLQAMISYKLFYHSKPLGPTIREILGLLDMIYLTLKM